MKKLLIIVTLLSFSCKEEVVWKYDPHQRTALREIVDTVVYELSTRGLEVDVENLGMKITPLKDVPTSTGHAYAMYAEGVLYYDDFEFWNAFLKTNQVQLRMNVLHELGHYLGLDHPPKGLYPRAENGGGFNIMEHPTPFVGVPEFEAATYDIFVDYYWRKKLE